MAHYLEELTQRLIFGLSDVDDAFRARHGDFLIASQNDDGGFSGREGPSDLYYTGFALRGLAMLGRLNGEVAEQAAGYLRGRLASQAVIIDLLSLLYGAALLRTAGIDILADVAPDWRRAVAEVLESFRRDDGGYAKTREGGAGSTYYTFLVTLCYQLIGLPPHEPDRMIAFVRSRRRDDGGFVEIGPMRRSGTNPTAAAVGLLKIAGALDDDVREGTTRFLVGMQTDDGGLRANTRIPFADVLSTFTGLLTLADLDALEQVDTGAARRYVESLEGPRGGFKSGPWDPVADVEYTFYGLGSVALTAVRNAP